MTEELYDLALVQLKDRLGLAYDDDDDTIMKPALKASYNWFAQTVFYNPTLEITDGDPIFTLIVERARYDLSNSVDIFAKNYAIDLGQAIAWYDFNHFESGDSNATK